MEEQESQEEGEKCIHVLGKPAPRAESVAVGLRREKFVSSFSGSFRSGSCSAVGSPLGFVIPPVVEDSAAPFLSPLCGFSARFLRALADTTLCFTRTEGARGGGGERERPRETGRERERDGEGGRVRTVENA